MTFALLTDSTESDRPRARRWSSLRSGGAKNTIQRDVISRGVFTSVKDLARKLMRYIRNYNKTATPIRWIYKNVGHRIHPDAI